MLPLKVSHAEQQAHSYNNFENARKSASEKLSYDSLSIRIKLTHEFRERCGYNPHEWQLDASEATILGLDTIVIANTGAGKTAPFMMLLMLDRKKKAIIVSPLKILQDDQASRFQKAGISAVAVNF